MKVYNLIMRLKEIFMLDKYKLMKGREIVRESEKKERKERKRQRY